MEPWERRMQEQREFEAKILADVQAKNPQMLQFGGPGRPAPQQQEPDLMGQYNRVKLTQAERMRMAKMYQGRAMVQELIQSGEIGPDEAGVLTRGVQFGLNPLQMRLQQEQLLMAQIRKQQTLDQNAELQALIAGGQEYQAHQIQRRITDLEYPRGSGNKVPVYIDDKGNPQPLTWLKPKEEKEERFDEIKTLERAKAYAEGTGQMKKVTVPVDPTDPTGKQKEILVPDPELVKNFFQMERIEFLERQRSKKSGKSADDKPTAPSPAATGKPPIAGQQRPEGMSLPDLIAEAIKNYRPQGLGQEQQVERRPLERLAPPAAPPQPAPLAPVPWKPLGEAKWKERWEYNVGQEKRAKAVLGGGKVDYSHIPEEHREVAKKNDKLRADLVRKYAARDVRPVLQDIDAQEALIAEYGTFDRLPREAREAYLRLETRIGEWISKIEAKGPGGVVR